MPLQILLGLLDHTLGEDQDLDLETIETGNIISLHEGDFRLLFLEDPSKVEYYPNPNQSYELVDGPSSIYKLEGDALVSTDGSGEEISLEKLEETID